MKTVNYRGLKPRQTYEEKINYLQSSQDIIMYPNREAKRIRNSPYLTQLDGIGMSILEEQQMNRFKEEEKEIEIKKLANASTQSYPELKTQSSMQTPSRVSQFFNISTPKAPSIVSSSSTNDLAAINDLEAIDANESRKKKEQVIKDARRISTSAILENLYHRLRPTSAAAAAEAETDPDMPELVEADTPGAKPSKLPENYEKIKVDPIQNPNSIKKWRYKEIQEAYDARNLTPDKNLLVNGVKKVKYDCRGELLHVLYKYDNTPRKSSSKSKK